MTVTVTVASAVTPLSGLRSPALSALTLTVHSTECAHTTVNSCNGLIRDVDSARAKKSGTIINLLRFGCSAASGQGGSRETKREMVNPPFPPCSYPVGTAISGPYRPAPVAPTRRSKAPRGGAWVFPRGPQASLGQSRRSARVLAVAVRVV